MTRPTPTRARIHELMAMLTTLLVVAVVSGSGLPFATADGQAMPLPLQDRVKHVVVLMLENRAFDHMFGRFPSVNGLSGFEYNLLNATDPNSERIYVSADAPYANVCDPDHSLPGTTYKMFGPVEAASGNLTTPSMTAFVEQENAQDGFNATMRYCNVMQGFAPTSVPVISALASEYAIMDYFFASHPGPTWPNRAFMLSATASGLTETGVWYENSSNLFLPSPTIYDQLMAAGGTWKHYYNDTPWELFLSTVAHHPEHVQSVEQLWVDLQHGNLPDFAFINPRCGINTTTMEGSNDDHPDHDVALGEQFIKDVYEAIRSSPQWNETLFVLTFDEHGGFYDHVPPPMVGVPPPDDVASYPDAGFRFDRLGMRIPTILVSPWIAKGTVVSSPPEAQKPMPTSQYDLTSIIATSRKLLPVLNTTGPLTKRDAWAATFEHVLLTEGTPRTDCPMWLPSAPKTSRSAEAEMMLPINGLQRDILSAHAHRLGVPHPHHLSKQAEVSAWLQVALAKHRKNVDAWRTKAATSASPVYNVAMIIPNAPHEVELWTMTPWFDGAVVTFSAVVDAGEHAANATEYCLTVSSNGAAYSVVTALPCYAVTMDVHQQWVVDSRSATIHPVANLAMCLSSLYIQDGAHQLYLVECSGDPSQSWGFGGTAAGLPTLDKGPGFLLNNGPYVAAMVRNGGPLGVS